MVRFNGYKDSILLGIPQTVRRTPRVSLVVVVPENHFVSPDKLAERLSATSGEEFEVIVACAGQPTNLSALQRTVGEAQFLLAPAGTTEEDLRALAMNEAAGDIVTLVNGELLSARENDDQMQLSS
jgi:hypothetical protein